MPKRLDSDDESFVKAPPNPYVRVSQHVKKIKFRQKTNLFIWWLKVEIKLVLQLRY